MSTAARTLLGRATRLGKASLRPISTSREVAGKRKGTIATKSKAVVAEPLKNMTEEKLSSTQLHYKCPKCAFSNPDKNSIKSHLREVHNAAPFSCPHCAEEFTNFKKLKDHLKKSHDVALIPIEPYELVNPNEVIQHTNVAPVKIIWPTLKYYMTLHPLKSQNFADFHYEEEPSPELHEFEAPVEIVWPSQKYFMSIHPLKSQDFANFNYDEETFTILPRLVPEKIQISWPSQKYYMALYPFKSPNLASFNYCLSDPEVKDSHIVEAIPVEQRSAFVQKGPAKAGTDVDQLIKESQEAVKKATNEALKIATEVSSEALKKATEVSNDALKKATEVFKNLMSSLK